MIHNTLDFIMTVWCAVSFVAFIAYKCNLCDADSYEASIKFCTVGIIKIFYEELTGKTTSDKIINQILILTNKESIELVSRFKEVFEFPKLCQYVIDNNGILRIDIMAFALVSKYKDINASMLREIICNITQSYFLETRECAVDVFIPIATEGRVLIAIPLSESARKILLENQSCTQEQQAHHEDLTEDFLYEEDSEG